MEKVLEEHPPLRLLGGVRGGYVPVADLDPDELRERRADELRWKQTQRARRRGVTHGEYVENVARNVERVRERRELEVWEREIRANERKIFREQLARDMAADGKWNRSRWGRRGPDGGDLTVPGIGRKIRANRDRLRRLIRANLKGRARGDDWNRMLGEAGHVPQPLELDRTYSIYGGSARKWNIGGGKHRDPGLFLDLCRPLVRKVLLEEKGPLKKSEITLNVVLRKVDPSTEGEYVVRDHAFKSGMFEAMLDSDFDVHWVKMVSTVLTRISKHQSIGSGWTLDKIGGLSVFVGNYNPLSGKSWIPLPKWIASKKAVVNLKNMGTDCFPLAVAAADLLRRYPGIRNLPRIPKILKSRAAALRMDGLNLPMALGDISKFEHLNPELSVVVYGVADEVVAPLRVARKIGRVRDVVCLFFWGDGNGNHHYSPIRNFSALTQNQRSKHGHTSHTCHNCMHAFTTSELLSMHVEDGSCYEHECQKTVFEDKTIRFEKPGRTQRVPFVVYSDTESFNTPMEPPDEPRNTTQISEQTPSGLGYCIVGPKGFDSIYRRFYTVSEYALALADDVRKIYGEWFLKSRPLDMSHESTGRYDITDKCYRCGFHLVQGENKVRDHDHFTGEFRGASCRKCNLAMKVPTFVPVYFHNLEGYDSHLIIREVSKLGEVDCIPRDREKYVSFAVKVLPKLEIRFLDSFKLMDSSLSDLVSTLRADDLGVTRDLFPDLTDTQLGLLRRKGIYPYDWVDGPEKLRRTSLPPIEDFYNRLSESPCAPEDYAHAQLVWTSFGMETMQEYHDLYLKSDITQLADVVEKFRSTCHETYGLDPPWYYTTPGLSWDAMLKKTGVGLKTMCDPDIHLFVEKAIRGGISVITKRHAEANHKYMDSYDPSKPSVFIAYLDMNNLYGCAMVDPLPTGDLVWMDDSELEGWADLDGGCFLEVDLDYPDSLHDLHSDYPMACERMTVGGSETMKLVPNLNNKVRYVIHHEELRQCLKHGLLLKKVHRGVKFSQSRWLAPYIDANTRLRTKSDTKFGQDFYKLMNNAVFGKTMEGVRNRVDIKLVNNGRRLNKLISDPRFRGLTSFSTDPDPGQDWDPDPGHDPEPLVAVEMGRATVKLDKPVYVGAAVLSISKVRMYEFFYEYVKPKWGDRVRLLFTDTDSLCLEIHTDDYYADIAADVDGYFDTSNIPADHPSPIRTGRNKRVLAMMKDEAGGRNVVEFVGLRPKMYAVRMEGDDVDTLKCKGVKRYVVRRMVFDEYRKCLFGVSAVYKSQNTLRSRRHRIYVERMTKKALCGEDDKRVILEDGVNTLPWGHRGLR